MATYTEIHIRRDSTLNWYASNPRLALGEPGVDMTLRRFKIGNGIDRWNDLPYMNDDLYKQQDKTTQEIADKVQMLLNKIAANKVDADTKIESLSSDFRTTRREVTSRMDAVEEEQAAYEEGLTARQTAYENKLTARQTGYEANLTAEFEGTKAEVHAGLEEFNDTRDKLTIRMDVIAGQSTEDTEILDARVDASDVVHPNLGHNVRSIHSKLLAAEAKEAADKTEIEGELAEIREADAAQDAELQRLEDTTGKQAARDEHLQEQIDETAEGILSTQAFLMETTQRAREVSDELEQEIIMRQREDEVISRLHHERAEHLQEQIDEVSGEVIRSTLDARARDEYHTGREAELQESIEDEGASLRGRIADSTNYLQEQADELAGVVLEEMSSWRESLNAEKDAREASDVRLQEESSNETRERTDKDAHIQEQTDELAETVLGTLSLIKDEERTRQEEASRQLREMSELEEREADAESDLSAGILGLSVLQSETMRSIGEHLARIEKTAEQDTGHLQSQIDDSAEAVIRTSLALAEEGRARTKDTEETRRELADTTGHLQEQADDNAESSLKLSLAVSEARADNAKLNAHLNVIEQALLESGILSQDDIPFTTDTDIDAMLDDVFSGNGGEETEPDEDEDFNGMLDEVFGS